MLSYEIAIGLLLINIVLCTGSLNITQIVTYQENIWFVFPFFPLFFIFFISALAETSRSPFDLPEAEGELVAGYNVEYSGWGFVLFFLSEYLNIIMTAVMLVLLFFGGWLPLPFVVILVCQTIFFHPLLVVFYNNLQLFDILGELTPFWFTIKVVIVLFLIIWIRASFPRYRYDQLMQLGWKIFLPIALSYLILAAGLIYGFDALPLKY
jgi:NADH-quinone oxidoreductase subunit H